MSRSLSVSSGTPFYSPSESLFQCLQVPPYSVLESPFSALPSLPFSYFLDLFQHPPASPFQRLQPSPTSVHSSASSSIFQSPPSTARKSSQPPRRRTRGGTTSLRFACPHVHFRGFGFLLVVELQSLGASKTLACSTGGASGVGRMLQADVGEASTGLESSLLPSSDEAGTAKLREVLEARFPPSAAVGQGAGSSSLERRNLE